jgi:hypothetical protein
MDELMLHHDESAVQKSTITSELKEDNENPSNPLTDFSIDTGRSEILTPNKT